MPRLTPEEIAEVTGRPAPQKTGPSNKIDDALDKLGELDGRMSVLTEKHRRPDESHEQALARILHENPTLYAEAKAARAQILRSKGLGADAAVGGV